MLDLEEQADDDDPSVVDAVLDVLAKHSGARRVILVTHSMGGIVARAAMALNPGVVASILGVVIGPDQSIAGDTAGGFRRAG